jgi:hypothetical protein
MSIKVRAMLPAVFAFFLSTSLYAQQEEVVMAADAIHHNGEVIQVCGVIVETNYARGSKGKPTYLNFTRPYPKHNFSVIVFKEDRNNFDMNLELLEKHQACVYGLVEVSKNRAQMRISLPDQMSARKIEAKAETKAEANSSSEKDDK